MQKIIIKNFGAIAYAEIEIKKVLVLIGEQASGKSTIAKLIYFFKSLRNDVFSQIYQDQERDYFDENLDIILVLQEKFYNWFGATKNFSDDFEIKFYYEFENEFELDKSLTLSLNKDRTIRCDFSQNFYHSGFQISISAIKKLLQKRPDIDSPEWLSHEQIKINYANIIANKLNHLFSCYQSDSLYVIAGRSATVSYSELFEKDLFASVQLRLDRNNELDIYSKAQTVDEILMLEFIKRIVNNKLFLTKYESIDKKNTKPQNLDLVKNKAFEILKGECINDNGEEKIIIDSHKSIDIRNASSGQQEVIRILQDIIVVTVRGLPLLRIVEEPEAHLFPIAQKNLIELLALMVNQNDENQLIITTHSPYILSVFNNLLFAQRVVDKNLSAEAEVVELMPKEFWLKAKDFSAYSLGNSFIEEENEYCESIFNQKTGSIKQNYLDAVSEMLGGDFNALYSIYTKSVRRR
jgi:predicted ATP-dependent endonuclease of OLD family